MENKEDSIEIIRKLQEAGFKAYHVGGCVRDKLLKREIHDYDIATSATPDEVKEVFPQSHVVGESFGVSLVRINKVDYEVATFRTDGDYGDGRRPDDVKYTRELKEDASRRDLTINAIYYDPIKHRYTDPFDGKKDIENRVIRFIGNPLDRIYEDKLRIMRAIRFSLQLDGFRLTFDTFASLRENIHLVENVAMERIRDEFFKIVETVRPSLWITGFMTIGLDIAILPELLAMESTPQNPKWHPEGDVLKHTCLVADILFDTYHDLQTTLAGVFHDLGKTTCTREEHTPDGPKLTSKGHAKESSRLFRELAARMLFPKKMTETLAEVAYDHMSLFEYKSMKKSTIKKYMNKTHSNILLNLLEADTEGTGYERGSNPGTELKKIKEEYVEKDVCNPKPLLTGRDLLVLGWKPSPHFSTVINMVRDMQLDGELCSHEEAIEFAKENPTEAFR